MTGLELRFDTAFGTVRRSRGTALPCHCLIHDRRSPGGRTA